MLRRFPGSKSGTTKYGMITKNRLMRQRPIETSYYKHAEFYIVEMEKRGLCVIQYGW